MISWEGCRSPRGTRYGNCVGSRVRGQKKLLPVVVKYTFLTIERQKIPDAHCCFGEWLHWSIWNVLKMLNVSKITSELIRCFEPQCFNYCGYDYELHWFHETRAHMQCVRVCVPIIALWCYKCWHVKSVLFKFQLFEWVRIHDPKTRVVALMTSGSCYMRFKTMLPHN